MNARRTTEAVSVITSVISLVYGVLGKLTEAKDVSEALEKLRHFSELDRLTQFFLGAGIVLAVLSLYIHFNKSAFVTEPTEKALRVAQEYYLSALRRRTGDGPTDKHLLPELTEFDMHSEVATVVRRYDDIYQALADDVRVVLVGGPGTGKTTALQLVEKEAIRIAQEAAAASSRVYIPLRVRLPELAQFIHRASLLTAIGKRRYESAESEQNNFAEAVLTQISLRAEVRKLDVGVLRHWIDYGEVLWLLDGLDEVSSDRVDLIARVVERQVYGKEPRPPVIITSRIDAYNAMRPELRQLFNPGRLLRIEPLTQEQIGSYAAENDAQNLLSLFSRDERLRELASSPFTLPLLALISNGIQASLKPEASVFDLRLDILSAYTRTVASRSPFTTEKVHRWLGEVSRVLDSPTMIPTTDLTILPSSDRIDVRQIYLILSAFLLAGNFALALPAEGSRPWMMLISASATASFAGLYFAVAPWFKRIFLETGAMQNLASSMQADPGTTIVQTVSGGVNQAMNVEGNGLRRLWKQTQNLLPVPLTIAFLLYGCGTIVASFEAIQSLTKLSAVVVTGLIFLPTVTGKRSMIVASAAAASVLLILPRLGWGDTLQSVASLCAAALFCLTLQRGDTLFSVVGWLLIWLSTFVAGTCTALHVAAAFSIAICSATHVELVLSRIGAFTYWALILGLPALICSYVWGSAAAFLVLAALSMSPFFTWLRNGIARYQPGYLILHRLFVWPILGPLLALCGKLPLRTKPFIDFSSKVGFLNLTDRRVSWGHALWRDYFIASAILDRQNPLKNLNRQGSDAQRVLFELIENSSGLRRTDALSALKEFFESYVAVDHIRSSRRLLRAKELTDDRALAEAVEGVLKALLDNTAKAASLSFQHLAVALDYARLQHSLGRTQTAVETLLSVRDVGLFWCAEESRLDKLVGTFQQKGSRYTLVERPEETLAEFYKLAGILANELGNSDAAVKCISKSLGLRERYLEIGHPLVIEEQALLGELLREQESRTSN